MESIVKQRLGKKCVGDRFYIEDSALDKINMKPGTRYTTAYDGNKIILKSSNQGNLISKRVKKDKVVPVIDKTGSEIRDALSECDYIKITFFSSETNGGMVEIAGLKTSADVLRAADVIPSVDVGTLTLKSITFCAGAGISSHFNEQAGFEEVAACEYNPKRGSEDRFSDIYTQNHEDTVMFNLPMEKLSGKDLPDADLWVGTLDCSDYSKLANTKTEFHTMHLFIHLIRLFWEREKASRPKTVFIENVPGFEKIAGNSLKLCFEEEGYFVSTKLVNSLDFGGRTQRERFFFVASIYDGYEFPAETGRLENSIETDGIITRDTLNWQTPEENPTIAYFINRNGTIKHNHKTKFIDVSTDTRFGTITKSAHNGTAENIISDGSGHFAYVRDHRQLRYLHDIPDSYYLGDSETKMQESIGQAVCGKAYSAIINSIYSFMRKRGEK